MIRTGIVVLALALVTISADASPSGGSINSRAEINREALLSRLVGLSASEVMRRLGKPDGVWEVRIGWVRWNYQWGKDYISVDIRNGSMTGFDVNVYQTGYVPPVAVNP